MPNIIDVEASGFGPHGYPIEVGVALVDGTRFCSLILPEPDWEHWDPDAERIHGVSRSVLGTYGKSLPEVTRILNERLENSTVYTDGWVVDQPWLNLLFHRAQAHCRFRISALENILTEPQMEIWHEIKSQIIAEHKLHRHRASDDAAIVQRTWLKTRELTAT